MTPGEVTPRTINYLPVSDVKVESLCVAGKTNVFLEVLRQEAINKLPSRASRNNLYTTFPSPIHQHTHVGSKGASVY